MKIWTEKNTETKVEQTTETVRVAECPWCKMTFDPDDAVEIHQEPWINRYDMWQDILEDIIARAPHKDPLDMNKAEMEAHKSVVSESATVDPRHLEEAVTEVDLTEYLLRGNVLKEIVEDAVGNANFYSEKTMNVCPECAKSIMDHG